jgi:hypothetical protein
MSPFLKKHSARPLLIATLLLAVVHMVVMAVWIFTR